LLDDAATAHAWLIGVRFRRKRREYRRSHSVIIGKAANAPAMCLPSMCLPSMCVPIQGT